MKSTLLLAISLLFTGSLCADSFWWRNLPTSERIVIHRRSIKACELSVYDTENDGHLYPTTELIVTLPRSRIKFIHMGKSKGRSKALTAEEIADGAIALHGGLNKRQGAGQHPSAVITSGNTGGNETCFLVDSPDEVRSLYKELKAELILYTR